MQSLRDKLLKAGLVSEDAAKKAEAEKEAAKTARPAPPERRERRDDRPPRRDDRPPRAATPFAGGPRGPANGRRDEAVAARVPKLPPMAGSKEAHRQQARKQLELDRQLRELVLANAVATEPGATPFYFVTRKNKLRRLELTAEQAKKLELGELAVVERPDPDKIEHALVPPPIAEQMLKLSERAVRFLNKEGAKVGFLSDEEISARASEADVPEAAEPAATAEPEAPVADKPAEPETFITIKRAPIP